MNCKETMGIDPAKPYTTSSTGAHCPGPKEEQTRPSLIDKRIKSHHYSTCFHQLTIEFTDGSVLVVGINFEPVSSGFFKIDVPKGLRGDLTPPPGQSERLF